MTPAQEEGCLTFLTEWYDPLPQLVKQYVLRYWPGANEVEMMDVKSRRLFLKRSPCPDGTSARDFRLGDRVLLYGREISVVECADAATRTRVDAESAQTVFVIGPEVFAPASGVSAGAVVAALQEAAGDAGALAKLRLFRLAPDEAAEVAEALGLRGAMAVRRYSAGPVLAGVFTGPDVVGRLRDAAADLQRQHGDGSGGGGGGAENGGVVCCAASAEQAAAVGGLLFGNGGGGSGKSGGRRRAATAVFEKCTCCVVKPHAVRAGQMGTILDVILTQGYEVTALEMFHLDRSSAAEFLEVYKGVHPHYNELVEELVTSPCVAMELRLPEGAAAATAAVQASDAGRRTAADAVDPAAAAGTAAADPVAATVVAAFRQTAGPWDVEAARVLRPRSLRARYGADNVRCAVHCTDLPEDGPLESRFFFELLQHQGA